MAAAGDSKALYQQAEFSSPFWTLLCSSAKWRRRESRQPFIYRQEGGASPLMRATVLEISPTPSARSRA